MQTFYTWQVFGKMTSSVDDITVKMLPLHRWRYCENDTILLNMKLSI